MFELGGNPQRDLGASVAAWLKITHGIHDQHTDELTEWIATVEQNYDPMTAACNGVNDPYTNVTTDEEAELAFQASCREYSASEAGRWFAAQYRAFEKITEKLFGYQRTEYDDDPADMIYSEWYRALDASEHDLTFAEFWAARPPMSANELEENREWYRYAEELENENEAEVEAEENVASESILTVAARDPQPLRPMPPGLGMPTEFTDEMKAAAEDATARMKAKYKAKCLEMGIINAERAKD
jgi:hypothetical protein